MRAARTVPIAVLVVAAAFLCSLDADAVRHASVLGMNECAFRQWRALPKELGLVVFGSSRVRAGISPEAFDRAAAGALPPSANLGRSGLGALRSYTMLRDLSDRGIRVRAVFLETDLDALQQRDPRAPIRPEAQAAHVRYSDLPLVAEVPAALGPLARLRLVLLTGLDKVRESIIPVLGRVPILAPLQPVGAPIAACLLPTEFERGERGRAELEVQRAAMAARYGGAAERGYEPGDAQAYQRGEELYFVDRVRALARRHGAVLVVARHGAAFEPPLSAEALAAVRRDIPEFVQPPAALERENWAEFVDATHLGPQGRARYSEWLAGEVRARLAGAAAGGAAR